MAGKFETKSITVPPNLVDATIKEYEPFFWELIGTDTVDSSNSHLEKRGDEIYSVTERKAYSKVNLRRSLDIPNITKVKELEDEYWSVKSNIQELRASNYGDVLSLEITPSLGNDWIFAAGIPIVIGILIGLAWRPALPFWLIVGLIIGGILGGITYSADEGRVRYWNEHKHKYDILLGRYNSFFRRHKDVLNIA